VHEHQPEALRCWVQAEVGTDNGPESPAHMLERLAAEFAGLAGADEVRGDLPAYHAADVNGRRDTSYHFSLICECT